MSDKRTILITGCSSGIGYDAAQTLRARGWRVFAGVRNDADRARLEGEGLETVILDYVDAASIHAAFAEVMARTEGRLDALFNNGAYGQVGAVEDLTTDLLREQFEANFFGWHELTRLVIPVMRQQRAGRIVQCSSIFGFTAAKFRGAYIAAKHAVEGLSDTMRLELDGTGIRVVLIEPGPIATRFVAKALEQFDRTINPDVSPHREAYYRRRMRMVDGGSNRFKLPPSAVTDVLIKALEKPNPRPRYRVTLPSKAASWAKRLLSSRMMDRVERGW